MLRKRVFNTIGTERPPSGVWKQSLTWLSVALSHPSTKRVRRIFAERNATGFASLPSASHVCAYFEGHILAAQPGEF
jgi:hypothetical protein